jgi:hypothetical protein
MERTPDLPARLSAALHLSIAKTCLALLAQVGVENMEV